MLAPGQRADATKAHGAAIGKAMTSLDSGKGLVLVLVNAGISQALASLGILLSAAGEDG